MTAVACRREPVPVPYNQIMHLTGVYRAPAGADANNCRRAAGDQTRYGAALVDDRATLLCTTIYQGSRPTARSPPAARVRSRKGRFRPVSVVVTAVEPGFTESDGVVTRKPSPCAISSPFSWVPHTVDPPPEHLSAQQGAAATRRSRETEEERNDTGRRRERAGRTGAGAPVDRASGPRRPRQRGGARLVQPTRVCRAASALRGGRPYGRGGPPEGAPARHPRPQSRHRLRLPGRRLPRPPPRHRQACAYRTTLAVRRTDRPGRDHRPGRTLVAGPGVLVTVCRRHSGGPDRDHLPSVRTPDRRPPGPRGGGHRRGQAAVLRPAGHHPDGMSGAPPRTRTPPRTRAAPPPAGGEDRPTCHSARPAAPVPAGRTHRTR
ncbi:hypothetical protein HNR57_000487 [Streptomyces paradoxus]|uniref:Uncharacterized protein n=1 Tax=Streptomyces paradoxus TaxID=66375 RepID=A0A7W9T5W3_9ACTN|nr:hypothetical protein [Streptomyces paradoxus]